jgi:hypothetical protein
LVYDNRLRQLSITSTACDTSSSLTFRLGTSLTQSFPAVNNNNPRSRASSTSRCGLPSRVSTRPRIKPQPRIGPTATDSGNHPESLSSRRCRRADVLLTCETNSRWLSRSKTWSPMEHERGDPPNVVPCEPVPSRTPRSDQQMIIVRSEQTYLRSLFQLRHLASAQLRWDIRLPTVSPWSRYQDGIPPARQNVPIRSLFCIARTVRI